MVEENRHTDRIDQLIALYHVGTASPEQKKELLSWLKISEDNKKYFRQVSDLWHISSETNLKSKINPEEEFEHFAKTNLRLSSTKSNGEPKPRQTGKSVTIKVVRWLSAAAVIAFMLFGATKIRINKVQLTSSNNVVSDTFPDGSVVSLNHESSVIYYQHLFKNIRNVEMTGEVYYEVAKSKENPFIISAGKVQIEVLGTSFNVNAFFDDVEVYVQEGIVDVSFIENDIGKSKKERIEAGAAILINAKTGIATREESGDINKLVWKTGEIVFENSPLKRVIKTLEDIHGVKIGVQNDSILNRKLNAHFSDTTDLSVVMQVLKLTFDVDLHIVKDSNTSPN